MCLVMHPFCHGLTLLHSSPQTRSHSMILSHSLGDLRTLSLTMALIRTPSTRSLTHAPTYTFTHSLTHLRCCSLAPAPIYAHARTDLHMLAYACTRYPRIHNFFHALTHSLSLTRAPTYSLTHALTLSPTSLVGSYTRSLTHDNTHAPTPRLAHSHSRPQ